MDPETFSFIDQAIYMFSGFIDFVLMISVIVVALRFVRPIEPGVGYAIAAFQALRFLNLCTSRSVSAAFDPIPFNDMNGAIPILLMFFSLVGPFLTIGLWASVLFALVRIAGRARPA